MPRSTSVAWLLVPALLAIAGCADNPYVLQGQLQTLQQQQLAMVTQNQELQNRLTTLDADNRELEQMLAEQRQQGLVQGEQLAALRDQLRSTTAQLTDARRQQQETENEARTLAASARRRGGATITANSSLRDELPALNLPGIEVRHDGDVVRIELPGDRLFVSGSAQLQPGAAGIVEAVAKEIYQTLPQHFIGIEGHTDSDPIQGSVWVSNHQLSTARAMAVYEFLTSRTMLKPDQLFVVGHGPNHPVVSNATQAGKARNRRVELVIYPERALGR